MSDVLIKQYHINFHINGAKKHSMTMSYWKAGNVMAVMLLYYYFPVYMHCSSYPLVPYAFYRDYRDHYAKKYL